MIGVCYDVFVAQTSFFYISFSNLHKGSTHRRMRPYSLTDQFDRLQNSTLYFPQTFCYVSVRILSFTSKLSIEQYLLFLGSAFEVGVIEKDERIGYFEGDVAENERLSTMLFPSNGPPGHEFSCLVPC